MSSEIIAWVVGKTRVVVAWLFSTSSYSAWGKDAALAAARQQAAEEMEEETLHLNTITTTVLTYLSYMLLGRVESVAGWLVPTRDVVIIIPMRNSSVGFRLWTE